MIHRFLLSTALVFVAGVSTAQDCDFAILNGRVMDPETNFDAVRNVCIKGDRIAAITEDAISGAEEIDASGHVVAPGFINTHSHSFAPFDQKMMAHDGTTTLLDTEGGVANARLFYDKYKGNSFLNYLPQTLLRFRRRLSRQPSETATLCPAVASTQEASAKLRARIIR